MKTKDVFFLTVTLILGILIGYWMHPSTPTNSQPPLTEIDSNSPKISRHEPADSAVAIKPNETPPTNSSNASTNAAPSSIENEEIILQTLEQKNKSRLMQQIPGSPEPLNSPNLPTEFQRASESDFKFDIVKGSPAPAMKETMGRIDHAGDPEKLLDEATCENSALGLAESSFIQERLQGFLNGRTWQGQIQLLKSVKNQDLQLRMFPQDKAIGFEVKGTDGGVYEKRLVPLNSNAWRMPFCGHSIVVVNNRCPWNASYSMEMKDIVYLNSSDQIAIRLSCKNPDSKWLVMGTSVLTSP